MTVRTYVAKLLFKLKYQIGSFAQVACDHKNLAPATYDGYITNFCWTCGLTKEEKSENTNV